MTFKENYAILKSHKGSLNINLANSGVFETAYLRFDMANTVYSGCPQVVSEFLFYSETIKNQSKRTVQGYFIDLRTFFRFMKYKRGLVASNIDFKEITIDDIDLSFVASITQMDIYEYLHYVMHNLDNNPNTRARKLSCLKSYFNYLTVKANKLQENPTQNIELPSTKKALPKYLTLDESLDLLQSVEGKHAIRDYCILTLFLNCGMRLSELVSINTADIREETIRIVGKGNKERMVFLNQACLDAIDAYLVDRDGKVYKNKDPDALFLSQTGSRLTARRIQKIVEETLQRAGLSGRGYSPHKLRHTAATLMYQHGDVDMLALKEILGHEHVTTTEIYTHISDAQLKNAVNASPLSNIKPPKGKNLDHKIGTEEDEK